MRLLLASRNGWTWSEDFGDSGDAVWSKFNATITDNATTAPNGTTTADKLVENADTGQSHVLFRDFAGSPTDNTDQTVSVFAKAAERTQLQIFGDTKAGTFFAASYDLSSGTVSNVSVAAASMEDAGNGWWRLILTVDVESGGAAPTANLRLLDGSGNTDYDGDGSSGLYVWGAQLEIDQSKAGGYASTTSAAFSGGLAGDPKNESTITWDAEGGVSRADLIMREENLSVSHGDTVVIDDRGTTVFVGNVVDIDYLGVTRPGMVDYRITCLDYVHRMGVTEVGSGDGVVYNGESDQDVVIDLVSGLSSIISATTSTVDEILSSIKQAFSSDTMVREAVDPVAARAGAQWSLDPNVAPAAVVALNYNSEANAGDAEWDVSDSPNGSTTFDVEGLVARHAFDDPGNSIIVVGSEDTFGRQIFSEATDATSISTYGTKRKRFSSPNITTQEQADEVAAALLAKHKNPYWVGSYRTKRDGLRVNQLQDLTHSGYGLSAETVFLRNIRAQQITDQKTQYDVSFGPDFTGQDKILRRLGALSTGGNSTPQLLRGIKFTGNEGYARHFASNTETDESIYQDASNGLTVSVWILRGDNITSNDRGILAATSSSFASSDGYFVGIDTLERLVLRSGGETWTGPTIPNDGQWHHVCMAWDGNYAGTPVTMYIDGASGAIGNSGSGSWSLNSGSNLSIGSIPPNWGFSQLAAWNIQLRDGDIQRLAARPDSTIPASLFDSRRIAYWRMDDFADGVSIAVADTLQENWNGFHFELNRTSSGTPAEGLDTHWNPLL